MTLSRFATVLVLTAACACAGAAEEDVGGMPPMMRMAPGPHPGGPGMHMPGDPTLTEAQQDKIFAIHHAAAPEQRELDKAVRKAHEALHAAAAAAPFDEAKAAALAQQLGQAEAAQALQRARTQAQVLAILTPEQRQQMAKDRPHPFDHP